MTDIIDRRSSTSEVEEDTATQGKFECHGCKKVHQYPLPLDEKTARDIVRQHRNCKHGRRKNVKYR